MESKKFGIPNFTQEKLPAAAYPPSHLHKNPKRNYWLGTRNHGWQKKKIQSERDLDFALLLLPLTRIHRCSDAQLIN